MNNKKKLINTAVALAVLSPIMALAQQDDGGSVPVGPFMLYPSLTVQYLRDDNILRQPSGTEQSDDVFMASPALDFRIEKGGQLYRIGYQAEVGRYGSSSADDYEDQNLIGELDVGLGRRGRLNMQAEYLDEHDARGTQRTEGAVGLPATPDEWHATRFDGTLSYGAEKAYGRVELNAGYFSKVYDNNRTLTAVRDRDNTDFGVTLYYNVAPRTDLLLQAAITDIDYATATLDSQERRYLAGITWEATAKTSGTVKIGRLEKNFDIAGRTNFAGSSWEASAQWSPRTYSTVDIATSRRTDETNGTGDFILTQDLSLTWNHKWSSDISTKVNYLVANDDYDPTVRQDDRTQYGVSMSYQVRRWLKVGVGYSYDKRESSSNAFDYKRNVYGITVGATL
ncbi:MAG: outer membrane beta-barrel protein [Gammaproteobacteria bacterium]|nr:outer membrane beta-barrel protein [Gammaproteobacteria bacterium]